jgi:biotin carboxyl carrier protein
MNTTIQRTKPKRRFPWWWTLFSLVVIATAATCFYWEPARRYVTTTVVAMWPATAAKQHDDHEGHDAHENGDDQDHHGELAGAKGSPDADGHDIHGAQDAHEHEKTAEAGHDHAKEAKVAEGLAAEHAAKDHDEHGDHDEHDEHDEHAHALQTTDHKHVESAAIKLSKQAIGNIRLQLTQVTLKPFERTINVPGIIIERPGWSVLEVTAPMTGMVTRIYPIQGEAVQPNQPLFDVRVTHEDLLQLQTEFLRTVEELDVIGREVTRLEKVTNDGVIAGKTLLERKYEQQKQQAALKAQRQALLLHGLSEEQIDGIVSSRTLLQSLTVFAPARQGAASETSPTSPLQVQELKVTQGKRVSAGETLCTLVDLNELYIEGMAFEQDIQAINRAASERWNVSARLGSKSSDAEEIVDKLHILYLDDKVDRESRAFRFFVTLPNHVLRQDKSQEGREFIYWQFKPGQRCQIRIPVEEWPDRIVLPVEAVAEDGAESYVFESNGDHFDRRAVHVEYRDQDWVVIANDGELRLGATVAASAAHQMQLALKNKSGGGVDPHAGHNH